MVVTRRVVELRVEELLLVGFPPRDRERIGMALERELTLLLQDGEETPRAASEAVAVQAGEVHLPRGAKPGAVGRAIAGGLHRRLWR
jgi:hypothetical protein